MKCHHLIGWQNGYCIECGASAQAMYDAACRRSAGGIYTGWGPISTRWEQPYWPKDHGYPFLGDPGRGEPTVTPQCQGCRFWLQTYTPSWGDCRVLPPQITADSPQGRWPQTKPEQWCGKWQEKKQ